MWPREPWPGDPEAGSGAGWLYPGPGELHRVEVTNTYTVIGFGDLHGPKPYKFIGFGDLHGPKPYKFIRFGDIHGPKAYNS